MRFAPVVVLLLCLGVLPRDARAEDDASLTLAPFQSETATWLSSLAPTERRRLRGTYVVLDPNPNDPFSQVACDDDGDHVVVVSLAMLALLSHVARAVSDDEASASHKVDDYASFLARSQLPARRLLPPPPAFYELAPSPTYEDRFSELVSFVVRRELAHLRAGDLSCPNPTPTKESGDDLWTNAERQSAAEIAKRIYPGAQSERDEEALSQALASGRTERGALGLLRFFARFETEVREAHGRFRPGYLALHPNAATRAEHLVKIVHERAL